MAELVTKIHRVDDSKTIEPYAVVTCVPNPGRRYEAGRRIVATLKRLTAGSDQSFLVDSRETAHHVAKSAGFEIRCVKDKGGKFRVWRIA